MSTPNFGQKISSNRKPEFQAVILAGYGTALQPLTNELSAGGTSSATPKALLPVGNIPMLFHPILWLQNADIRDILVICPASHKALIHEAIWRSDESSPSFSHLSITLEGLDDSEAASLDTADILRRFTDRFITDLIILPCDFIPPPALKLSSIINDYRVDLERPPIKVLLYERGDSLKDEPGSRIYCIDKQTQSLICVGDTDDGEDFEVGMNMLWQYPNTHITRRFLDAHVYIVRHAILELLAGRPSLTSFKDDFIPWFCKLSYRKSHRKKYLQSFRPPPDPQSLALQYSSMPYTRFGSKHPPKSAGKMSASVSEATNRNSTTSPVPSQGTDESRAMSPLNNAVEDLQGESVDPNSMRCGVTLHRMKDGYAGRANTIGAYFELNRQALVIAAAAAAGPVHTPLAPTYGTGAHISSDSKIAASVRVGERTAIKKSVVGPHCVIGKNVKIAGCVIMDHVEIKDGAKLENTILSRNTAVGERAQLKECEIAPGVTVQNDVSLKGERLSQW